MPLNTTLQLGKIILPELGGLIGSVFGTSRDDKRQARQQYRDALIGAGVRSSLVQPWHSDEHEAGRTLLQIAQMEHGVEFLNKNMPSRITRNSVSSLPERFGSWLTKREEIQSASTTSGGSPVNLKSAPSLLGLGGIIFWAVKKWL